MIQELQALGDLSFRTYGGRTDKVICRGRFATKNKLQFSIDTYISINCLKFRTLKQKQNLKKVDMYLILNFFLPQILYQHFEIQYDVAIENRIKKNQLNVEK